MKTFTLWVESMQPPPFPTKIVSPRESVYDVMDANFHHGVIIGRQTVSTSRLINYVSMNQPAEVQRIQTLIAKMTSPRGYWERPIVDEQYEVIEGQHRVEAAKQIGWARVPVFRVADLGRMYNYKAMQQAVMAAGVRMSDYVYQLVGHALDAIHSSGGNPEKAIEDYQVPQQYMAAWEAAIRAAKSQAK